MTLEQRLAALFVELRELEKTDPGRVENVVTNVVSHVRSWRPEAVCNLSDWPATEVPTDPRVKS